MTGRPYIDLEGKVFGNLTVVGKTAQRDSKGSVLWELRCSCGETCFATSSDLKRGRRGFCEKCRKEVSDMSPYRSLYGTYRRNARKRNLSFELTLEEFIKIIKEDCVYCGEPGHQWFKKSEAKEGIFYSGIDREDNQKGYTSENSVPCCKFCNKAKSTLTREELVGWLNRVTERRMEWGLNEDDR